MTHPAATDQGNAWRLPLLAAGAAVLAHFALQVAAWMIAGVFEYPLDDPYIHLAIAEQIASGGYGVNDGEIAAAASSPIYPLLLTPFAESAVQRYLPLFWNVVGLVAAALLWGRILWQAGYRGGLGVVLAIAGPVALNMTGLAFTGMEHMLHTAASLAIVLGLLILTDEDRLTPLLVLGILLAPLLRFEGMALALAAALAVLLLGRVRAGIGLGLLAVLPVMGFCALLWSMGLDPVPSSVRFKMTAGEVVSGGPLEYFRFKLYTAMHQPPGQILLLSILLALGMMFLPGIRTAPRRILLLTVALAGVGHVLLGKFGWFDRYEIYILATMSAGLLAAAPLAPTVVPRLVAAVPVALAGVFYLPTVVAEYPHASRPIHVQQGQMARFAKDFLNEPVAVNDIGYVAWHNPDYVLDLWGLANADIMRLIEAGENVPGWAGAQAAEHGIKLAMLYAGDWFRDEEMGAGWQRIGVLHTDVHVNYLGSDEVVFWLSADAEPEAYTEKLRAWAEGLPEGARFTFTDSSDEEPAA